MNLIRCRHSLPLLLLCSVAAVAAEAPRMAPFQMDWRARDGVLLDASFLLDKPAGKDGHLTARDGHLVRPDGSRFRIWGVNCTFGGEVSKQDAGQLAAYWARLGVNCIRFHYLDSRSPGGGEKPRWCGAGPCAYGIIDSRYPDSRHLDPEALDRFDYLVAELKKQGIYTNINLNVTRTFQEGDGVKDARLIGWGKGLTHIDPRLIELQQEYARALLTHKNPYTGNEYRHEPALAIAEMVNENSLVESWQSGRLRGNHNRPGPPDWIDIPATYERDITARFNEWLREKLPAAELDKLRAEAGVSGAAPVPRLDPKEFEKASARRFGTEARFYMDVEDRYFQSMYRLLKDELGSKSLVVGSSVHNYRLTPYPALAANAKLDVVDAHTYWQLHQTRRDEATAKRNLVKINTPMVRDPGMLTIVHLQRGAMAGKPFTVSELNHPFPDEWAAEGIPIETAYAAFHDWDGIFWYRWELEAPEAWPTRITDTSNIFGDPMKISQLAAGAFLFLRGDVSPARRTLRHSYNEEQVIESLRMDRTQLPIFNPGIPRLLPLVHGLRVESLSAKPSVPAPMTFSNPIVSDTGELQWYHSAQDGAVTIDSPRAQAVVGFSSVKAKQPRNLTCDLSTPFGAILLVSVDGKPLAESGRMLLTAGARCGNTGMQWNAARNVLLEIGSRPTLIEVVTGTVTLTNLAAATKVEAVPLDGSARQLAPPEPAEKTPAGWRIRLGRTATPWFLLRVTRTR